jgi:cysteine desulfurase/selenocysteine lyase
MTIPTPTSNPAGVSGLALPVAEVPAGLPAGLPDPAALAQLANAFFTALPGAEPEAAIDLTPAGAAPQLSPLPTAQAVPVEPRVPVQGVPTQYAAALPQAASGHGAPGPAHPVSVQSSRYYFLGEASGYQSAVPHAGVAASEAGVPDDRVSAQSFHLPGTDALARLIDGAAGTPPAGPDALRQPGGAVQAGQFYFLAPPTLEAPRDTSHQPHRASTFDVQAVRRDFPILAERVNGRPLIWLDNAATTHKPQAVTDRLAHFYAHENSNIHRAAHELAARATDAYEGARNKVARFLGARSADEIIFVRGATEAINLVAQTFGRQHIGAGDEIIVSHLEHHANIVPWQQLAAQVGARIRVIPVDDSGQILLDEYRKLLSSRTKLVSVTQVSNALGTVTPVQEIIGRRAGGIAPARERAGAGCGLLRVLRPQDLWAHGHRRGVRQAGPARHAAAVAGRRQHDRRRDLREDAVPARARAFRGRHRQHRRCGGAGRRARLRRACRPGAHRAL